MSRAIRVNRFLASALGMLNAIAAVIVALCVVVLAANMGGGPAVLVFLVVTVERPHVPEPALAACLVSAVAAVVIWLIYLAIRFGLRITAATIWGAAKS